MVAASEKPAVSREKISVMNPATGELVGEVDITSPDNVRAAVQRARTAQYQWGKLGVSERVRILRRFGDLLWARRDDIIQVIRAENGKTESGALLEAIGIDMTLTWLLHNAPRILHPQRRRAMFPIIEYGRVYFKPYGVVGFITPWNYPLLLVFLDVLPALAAGNAAVIKPSEITPFTTLRVVELMYEAGIPKDLVQVVTGAGQTGAALVDEVDYVHLTGSVETGRKVAAQAAKRMIPCSLELGGKAPMIVLQDADLDLAASSLIAGGLLNAGQECVSIERVYVEAPVHDDFVERVLHYLGMLKMGPEAGRDVHLSTMTNERELLRVEAQVADALAKGAKLLAGGQRRPDLGPYFYEPTILTDTDHTMDVMTKETFGPVIPIMRVRDADEAVRLANDSSVGLSSAIFTRDLARGERLATQLNTGDVSVNRTAAIVIGSPAFPWGGGHGESGTGRRGGPEGLLRFVKTQSVLLDHRWERRADITYASSFLLFNINIMRTLRRWIPFL